MTNLYAMTDGELRVNLANARKAYGKPPKREWANTVILGLQQEQRRRAVSEPMTRQWHRRNDRVIDGFPDAPSNTGDWLEDYALPPVLAELFSKHSIEQLSELTSTLEAVDSVYWEFNEAMDRKQREALPQYLRQALEEL